MDEPPGPLQPMAREMRLTGLFIAMVGIPLPGQAPVPRPLPPAGQDAPAREDVLPPFELGPGNWPVPREGLDAPSGRTLPRSDFDSQAAEHWPVPLAVPGGASSGLRLDSPLRDVFKAVRQPAEFAALGGVTVWLQVTLFDELGEELGTREITHEADLAYPDRDCLMFADGRVYGRLGDAVFARRNRRPWPTLQDEARGELALFGTLLRAPWVFADVARFQVFPDELVTWRGTDMVRIRVERRPSEVTPARGRVPVDRFELICDPDTFAPRQLLFQLGETGAVRRVRLDDYREYGGLRFPARRTILVENDRVAMVMQVTRIEIGQRFSEDHFRPHQP